MLHKPYKEKVDDISILYRHVVKEMPDSTTVFAYIDKFREWAVENNDIELIMEADMLRAYYYRETYSQKHPELIKHLIAVAEEAKNRGILHIEERAVQSIAVHYWAAKNYQKAFEWNLRSEKILKKLDPEEFPNMADHLNHIARAYYYFRDYELAVAYYKKSSQLKPTDFNALSIMDAKNTLGLTYQKLGLLAKSDSCFLSIINDTTRFSFTIWKGIASGNLGYNHYIRGDYQKAIPLLQYDVEIALKNNDTGLAAGSTTVLADIYLKQNKLEKSKKELEKADRYIRFSKQYERFRKLYPIMSKWHAANGQPDSSAMYLDSALIAHDKHNHEFSQLKLLRANQEVEAKEHKVRLEKLKSKNKEKIIQRNSVIVFVLLLLIMGVVFYFSRNKYLLRKQQIKELELQNANEALKHARTRLQNLTHKVIENKKLIRQLQKAEGNGVNYHTIQELKKGTILTSDDWKQYQRLFEEAHPGFIDKLKTSYDEFTPAELRCLCLEKLSLKNKEMASILGISANAVMVTKHRIRKKLGVENNKAMEQWVRSL